MGRATPKRTLIGKLIRLPRSELVELLRAQAALVAAHLIVWTRPQGQLVSRKGERQAAPAPVSSSPAPRPPRPGHTLDTPRATRLALAVSRAARYGLTRPKCLVRAVALQRLLAAHGMDGTIRIGVRRIDGRFDAHAWVELGDMVLGDDEEHTATFEELPEVSIVEKR